MHGFSVRVATTIASSESSSTRSHILFSKSNHQGSAAEDLGVPYSWDGGIQGQMHTRWGNNNNNKSTNGQRQARPSSPCSSPSCAPSHPREGAPHRPPRQGRDHPRAPQLRQGGYRRIRHSAKTEKTPMEPPVPCSNNLDVGVKLTHAGAIFGDLLDEGPFGPVSRVSVKHLDH